MRLFSCCFQQYKDIFGEGRSVVDTSTQETGYYDILRKLQTEYWDRPNTIPKWREKSGSEGYSHFLVFVFEFAIPVSKIQRKDFIAWLSLLFREFVMTTTKAQKSHSLYKCFDAI